MIYANKIKVHMIAYNIPGHAAAIFFSFYKISKIKSKKTIFLKPKSKQIVFKQIATEFIIKKKIYGFKNTFFIKLEK